MKIKLKKEDILKMNKEELNEAYSDIPIKIENKDCSNCSNCYNCYNCSDCSYCSYCTSQKNKEYMILDVQFTKDEYEKWKLNLI